MWRLTCGAPHASLPWTFGAPRNPAKPHSFRARLDDLVNVSLLKIDGGRLEMHDSLQALGWAAITAVDDAAGSEPLLDAGCNTTGLRAGATRPIHRCFV